MRHWVARDHGLAVGAATSFLFDATVLLVRCCVLPEYRRRGVATALTRAREHAALGQGATHAVFSPSPDGVRLHESLGFTLDATPANRWFYIAWQ